MRNKYHTTLEQQKALRPLKDCSDESVRWMMHALFVGDCNESKFQEIVDLVLQRSPWHKRNFCYGGRDSVLRRLRRIVMKEAAFRYAEIS